jgi:uncharacterized protein
MRRIGLLSDTHSFIHPRVYDYFAACDEIWHAGDIGDLATAETLAKFKTFRAVYGNIDGADLMKVYPRDLVCQVEGVKVFMTHIGGYPGNYPKAIQDAIRIERPKLFICGHSHILKVMYDKQFECLHINPGAAGKFGIHQSLTLVRFCINEDAIEDLEVLDIPRGNGTIKI